MGLVAGRGQWTRALDLLGLYPGGGGGGYFDDLYPDVCVEGYLKGPILKDMPSFETHP